MEARVMERDGIDDGEKWMCMGSKIGAVVKVCKKTNHPRDPVRKDMIKGKKNTRDGAYSNLARSEHTGQHPRLAIREAAFAGK
jgi:hypothetical protein